MLVASAQTLIATDVGENGRCIRDAMRQAAAARARLVHFPEGALSDYARSQ